MDYCDEPLSPGGLECVDNFNAIKRRAELKLEPKHYLKTLRQRMKKLMDDFMDYISVLPVFGYNSGSYDLNLIKENLFS